MRITIAKSDLVKTLSHLYRIVEKKSTIPVLSNIKMEAEDKLKFTATNIDLEIVEVVTANIEERGSTTLPVHLFYDIVRKLSDGNDVVIKTTSQDSNVVISSGNSEFTIPTLPASDFPVMTASDMPFKFSVPVTDLIKLIDKTKFAVSTEETRYFLNGIFFHALEKDGKQMLRAVATDGHRLARQDVECPEGANQMPGIIIPRRVINELTVLLADSSDNVKIETSETKARFTFGNITFVSKLIDAKFPNYENAIPTTNNKNLEVDSKLFSNAVDRVSSVSYEKSKAIKLRILKNKLTLLASTPDAGSAVEDVEIAYDDEEMDIGFNSKYLIDIAEQIEGRFMKFVISDPSSPAIIKELDDESVMYVLMPMRI